MSPVVGAAPRARALRAGLLPGARAAGPWAPVPAVVMVPPVDG